MIIKSSSVRSDYTTVEEVIIELYKNNELLDFCKSHNMRTGDAIEAMAQILVYDEHNIDTNEYTYIC